MVGYTTGADGLRGNDGLPIAEQFSEMRAVGPISVVFNCGCCSGYSVEFGLYRDVILE